MPKNKCQQCGQPLNEETAEYCQECLAKVQSDLLGRWHDLGPTDTEHP